MIAIELRKQQTLDVDPKAIQQLNFSANIDRPAGAMFFIIEEAKETVLDLFTRNCKNILVLFFALIYN